MFIFFHLLVIPLFKSMVASCSGNNTKLTFKIGPVLKNISLITILSSLAWPPPGY